jgi:glycosyltransferase involved in cell wall biosynthesis
LEAGKGGLEVMSADLALALVQRGIRAVVLTLDAGGEQADRLAQGGVRVLDLGGRRLRDPRYHWRIAAALRSTGADVVHTHMFAPLLFATGARWLAGVGRLVHTEHSIEYLVERPAYRKRLRWLARGATCFVVLGERMRRFYVDEIGIAPERVRVIPNGVVVRELDEASRRHARRELDIGDEFVVGAVGRLAPEKNLDLLLRAFARAMGADSATILVLVGDGVERQALETKAEELGIARRVRFTGWRQNVSSLLPAFDAYALTSISEGLPLALLEAMSAGVPVVSTSVGDIPDVIRNGVTGRLVPSGEEAAVAAALDEARNRPDLRREWARAARALVVQRYSLDAMVDAYMTAYGLTPDFTTSR